PAPADGQPVTIGKYRVVAPLGEGGQGQVYRVVHPGLGKDLVLKLARRPIAADAAGRGRLTAEARLRGGLGPPHPVRVVDPAPRHDRPFLVMEYPPGVHLEQYAATRRLPPRAAAALVAELARVVDLLHRRGIVHQDIKPRNILIDAAGRPRLLDFGLARRHDAWSDGPDEPSGGTLMDMAPEQARDESGRLGPPGDTFAL